MAAPALSRLEWHLRIGTTGFAIDPRRLMSGLAITVGLGMLYGATMGTANGIGLDRFQQIAYSAVKVPILFLLTFAICLPSFFVLNSIAGVRDDFRHVFRSLLLSQAVLAIVLVSLAPYTAMWYVSFEDHEIAVLFNGVMFAIASGAAQIALLRLYRPLIARRRRHRMLWATWLVLYVFVGVQLAWVLRPFVGSPVLATQFFREDSWSNAYVVIAGMIWKLLGG